MDLYRRVLLLHTIPNPHPLKVCPFPNNNSRYQRMWRSFSGFIQEEGLLSTVWKKGFFIWNADFLTLLFWILCYNFCFCEDFILFSLYSDSSIFFYCLVFKNKYSYQMKSSSFGQFSNKLKNLWSLNHWSALEKINWRGEIVIQKSWLQFIDLGSI